MWYDQATSVLSWVHFFFYNLSVFFVLDRVAFKTTFGENPIEIGHLVPKI